MGYLFLAAQVLAVATAWWLFCLRGYRWTLRHTLLCIIAPPIFFVLWTSLWWFGILPADRLPATWFDGAETVGERTFFFLPPFVASWILFFVLRGSLKQSDNAA